MGVLEDVQQDKNKKLLAGSCQENNDNFDMFCIFHHKNTTVLVRKISSSFGNGRRKKTLKCQFLFLVRKDSISSDDSSKKECTETQVCILLNLATGIEFMHHWSLH